MSEHKFCKGGCCTPVGDKGDYCFTDHCKFQKSEEYETVTLKIGSLEWAIVQHKRGKLVSRTSYYGQKIYLLNDGLGIFHTEDFNRNDWQVE